MNLFYKIFKPKRITLPNGKTVLERRSRLPLILFAVLIATAVAIRITGFDPVILAKRIDQFFVILRQMFPPQYNYTSKILSPLFDTIKMSLLGSAVGALLAIPAAVFSSNNITKNRLIVYANRLFLSIVRTLPTLVTALVATYVFGLGTLAGTVAIAVFTFAYVGKQLYEQIETVDMGAHEAMTALGSGKLSAFWTSISPQVMPAYLSTCLFCLEGNVRYAAILGYVGAGGLGIILNEKIGWREYDSVGMILILLFVTVAAIEMLSHVIRRKLT
ncbi:MAG: phosphonate ABC transporter, permease protein PhnE [Oscillospiraceae bacterium]|jgi:phosphonate transport system permease protein|nr:phosphonate ABC transporter, permease protein PhnE [Oscillospiraceae bacterium]